MNKKYGVYLCQGCGIGESLNIEKLSEVASDEPGHAIAGVLLMLDNLLLGFSISLTVPNLFYCFVGCALGTIIGVLPGLGPPATIAMLLSPTYKLDLTSAIIMLAGIYYGAQYGGIITSVLFSIPGEASSVITIVDGYQMTLRGRAGKALGIGAFGSFIAGTFGTIALSVAAPWLSTFALGFGPPEYTSLLLFGLTLVIFLGNPCRATSCATAASSAAPTTSR